MTFVECDSTTNTESFLQDGSHHSYGCTGIGSPCSSSLLRLALITGSAYARRFTTCAVNTRLSERRAERTKRTHPYEIKSKHSEPVMRPTSTNDKNGSDVSSSTDLKFGNKRRIDSTIQKQVIDNFRQGLSIRYHSDKIWNPVESSRTLRKAQGNVCEEENQRFAEK